MTPLEYTFNDSYLGIVVRADGQSTSVEIRAGNAHARDPIPMLQRAIGAIQAEIDGYHGCPMHAALRATPPVPSEGLRKLLERAEGMYAEAQTASAAAMPGSVSAWENGYAEATRDLLGDIRALVLGRAGSSPTAPRASSEYAVGSPEGQDTP